jgi:hypothetical protein
MSYMFKWNDIVNHSIVIGLNLAGIKPTIYQTSDEHTYYYTTEVLIMCVLYTTNNRWVK